RFQPTHMRLRRHEPPPQLKHELIVSRGPILLRAAAAAEETKTTNSFATTRRERRMNGPGRALWMAIVRSVSCFVVVALASCAQNTARVAALDPPREEVPVRLSDAEFWA